MTYWGAGDEVPERENQEDNIMATNYPPVSNDAEKIAEALMAIAKALMLLGASIEKSHNNGQLYPG